MGAASACNIGAPESARSGAASGLDAGAATSTRPPVTCEPHAGGPYWIEEGARVEAKVACRTGRALPPSAFTLAGLPAGASYDAARATFSWTPRLDQAAVYMVEIRTSGGGGASETGELKIGVADKFDDPNNLPIADPLTYPEEFGLPVIHLKAAPAINRDDYTPATVVYRGRLYQNTEAKYRGASLLGIPERRTSALSTRSRRAFRATSASGCCTT